MTRSPHPIQQVDAGLMWFRRDLRLADNEALCAAAAEDSVTPLFVIDPVFFEKSGNARISFLLRSLRELNVAMGGSLVVRSGNPEQVVLQVAREAGAKTVFAAKDFAPYGQSRDAKVSAALSQSGITLQSVGSAYAVEPGNVLKGDGTPYAVFTPFSKIWMHTPTTLSRDEWNQFDLPRNGCCN